MSAHAVRPNPESDHTPGGLTLESPLLRPTDAARLLGVKPSWVYDAVRAGNMPCLRVGRHIRFTRAMIESWLTGQTG